MSTSEIIKSIHTSREETARIIADSLGEISGKSEYELQDLFINGLEHSTNLYKKGWYDPPPKGASVLFGQKPFERLQYDSLRREVYWPQKDSFFEEETVASVYLSSVNKKTNMIGDISLSIYNGTSNEIKEHLKLCRDTVHEIAKKTEIDMAFKDLCILGMGILKEKGLKIGWMVDDREVNFGHTVPGSYEKEEFGGTFEEIKEAIRTTRTYIHLEEDFVIKPTCAFTIEARLVDIEETMPNVIFHYIVSFSDGERNILSNFGDIFEIMGMDYMLN